ncbi:MAG: amino acid kinase family protein, partial [Candidatus Odinarchaeia archaeon]
TNAVAALLAEITESDLFINLTDVDGVYTSNPKKDKNAKFLSEIKVEDFESLVSNMAFEAGNYPLFDPLALKIVKRSRIKTIIANGLNPDNLNNIIKGKQIGTRIIF